MQLSSEEDAAIADVVVNGHSLLEAKKYVAARDKEISRGPQLEQTLNLTKQPDTQRVPLARGAEELAFRTWPVNSASSIKRYVQARNAQRQQSYNDRLAAFNAAHPGGYVPPQIWRSDLQLTARLTFGDEARIVVQANVLQVKIV